MAQNRFHKGGFFAGAFARCVTCGTRSPQSHRCRGCGGFFCSNSNSPNPCGKVGSHLDSKICNGCISTNEGKRKWLEQKDEYILGMGSYGLATLFLNSEDTQIPLWVVKMDIATIDDPTHQTDPGVSSQETCLKVKNKLL